MDDTVPPIKAFEPDAAFQTILESAGFPLPEVRKLADIAKARAITDWAHGRWAHDGDNDPGTSDPKLILERAAAGERFRCVEYAVVAAAVARCVGLRARTVGLQRDDVETAEQDAGHVVAELFLPEYGKWAMVDPQWAKLPALGGIPLGAAEFAKAARSGLGADERYLRWVSPYLFYLAFRVDQRFGLNDRSPDRIILVPRGAAVPEKFQGVPLAGKTFPAYDPKAMYGMEIDSDPA